MPYNTIQLSRDVHVATISLNRPDKRNAISYELIDDMLGALDDVAESDARAHPHRRRQGILLGHGPRQPESAHEK